MMFNIHIQWPFNIENPCESMFVTGFQFVLFCCCCCSEIHFLIIWTWNVSDSVCVVHHAIVHFIFNFNPNQWIDQSHILFFFTYAREKWGKKSRTELIGSLYGFHMDGNENIFNLWEINRIKDMSGDWQRR